MVVVVRSRYSVITVIWCRKVITLDCHGNSTECRMVSAGKLGLDQAPWHIPVRSWWATTYTVPKSRFPPSSDLKSYRGTVFSPPLLRWWNEKKRPRYHSLYGDKTLITSFPIAQGHNLVPQSMAGICTYMPSRWTPSFDTHRS